MLTDDPVEGTYCTKAELVVPTDGPGKDACCARDK